MSKHTQQARDDGSREAALPSHPLLLCVTRSVARSQVPVPAGTDYLQLCQQCGNNPDGKIQLKNLYLP